MRKIHKESTNGIYVYLGTYRYIDLSEYDAGVKVRHKKFGDGIITKTEPEGDDLKIDIDFEKFGHKRLMAKYANLEII